MTSLTVTEFPEDCVAGDVGLWKRKRNVTIRLELSSCVILAPE